MSNNNEYITLRRKFDVLQRGFVRQTEIIEDLKAQLHVAENEKEQWAKSRVDVLKSNELLKEENSELKRQLAEMKKRLERERAQPRRVQASATSKGGAGGTRGDDVGGGSRTTTPRGGTSSNQRVAPETNTARKWSPQKLAAEMHGDHVTTNPLLGAVPRLFNAASLLSEVNLSQLSHLQFAGGIHSSSPAYIARIKNNTSGSSDLTLHFVPTLGATSSGGDGNGDGDSAAVSVDHYLSGGTGKGGGGVVGAAYRSNRSIAELRATSAEHRAGAPIWVPEMDNGSGDGVSVPTALATQQQLQNHRMPVGLNAEHLTQYVGSTVFCGAAYHLFVVAVPPPPHPAGLANTITTHFQPLTTFCNFRADNGLYFRFGELIHILKTVLLGIVELHTEKHDGLAHGAINPSNVLIGSGGGAVANGGSSGVGGSGHQAVRLSGYCCHTRFTMGNDDLSDGRYDPFTALTIQEACYTAPDFVPTPPQRRPRDHHRHDVNEEQRKNDIWALGVTAWELMSYCRLQPYQEHIGGGGSSSTGQGGGGGGVCSGVDLLMEVRRGLRLMRPSSCPESLWNDVIAPCFRPAPSRPSARELLSSLQRVELATTTTNASMSNNGGSKSPSPQKQQSRSQHQHHEGHHGTMLASLPTGLAGNNLRGSVQTASYSPQPAVQRSFATSGGGGGVGGYDLGSHQQKQQHGGEEDDNEAHRHTSLVRQALFD